MLDKILEAIGLLLRGAVHALRLFLANALLWLYGPVMLLTYGLSGLLFAICVILLVFDFISGKPDAFSLASAKMYYWGLFYSFVIFLSGAAYQWLTAIIHPNENVTFFF